MPEEPQKLSLKTMTKQIIQDLRVLQSEGKTLPDILYNYRIEDGRLVRKKPRRGSYSEQDREETVSKQAEGKQ